MTKLTIEEASDLVQDDIMFWLNNPFMTPELLAEKVCWWMKKALDKAGST